MIKTTVKSLIWLADSLESVKKFSSDAKKEAGFQLNRVQEGNPPADWKSMEIVGSGVREIRIKSEKSYRILYVAKFIDAIYVLHAFEKKHSALAS